MTTKRLAFIYPGQGSQVVGMGKDLAEHSPMIRHFFREADESLNRDMTQMMFEGPDETLKNTANAQPALLLHELALTKALEQLDYRPAITAGHSVGEYAALVTAGVLDFGHALWLVDQRGKLMSTAGESAPGGMVAVLGLEDDQVAACCAQAGGTVGVANYNSPGQVVISGETEALNKASELCKQAGAKRCLPLPVSGAFHSPLLKEAASALGDNIERTIFRDALVPVITNVDGEAHTSGDRIKANLLLQMESCVQWTKTMKAIEAAGVDAVVEIGPGSILSGLAKRITPNLTLHQVGTWEQLRSFTGANID